MKKIPSQADLATDTSADELPVLPGTEEPRSLGDLMREAEAASAEQQASQEAGDKTAAIRPRKSKKPSRAQSRRYARERALQALYQWDVSSEQSSTIRQEFIDTQDMSRVDVDYFLLIYNGVSHNPQVLDDALEASLDRPIADLDPIERSVLRIAAFELRDQTDIPARVVINEGIEITKRFGADKGHRYVNGVLDKLAMSLRPQEMRPR
ncbi:MAG: transcription antitermination factor NusB [Granulosicoccus sp.]